MLDPAGLGPPSPMGQPGMHAVLGVRALGCACRVCHSRCGALLSTWLWLGASQLLAAHTVIGLRV